MQSSWNRLGSLEASWRPLGTLLERSWRPSGPEQIIGNGSWTARGHRGDWFQHCLEAKYLPKRSPRGQKKRSRTTRRNKHRAKSIPRPSWIGPKVPNPSLVSPLGDYLGGQIGTKREPKTIQNRSENSRAKKPIQDDLGPVLGRSWAVLGRHLGRKKA